MEGQTPRSSPPAVDDERAHSEEESFIGYEAVLPSMSSSAYSDNMHPEDHDTHDIISLNQHEGQMCPTLSLSSHTNPDVPTTQQPGSPSLPQIQDSSPPSPLSSGRNISDRCEDTSTSATSPRTALAKSEATLEQLTAVKWARKKCSNTEAPEAKAWLVQTVAMGQSGTNARIWTSPEGMIQLRSAHTEALQQSPHASTVRAGAFKHGRPLLEMSVSIHTCVGAARPRKLHRAVHAGMPFEGIAARGFEIVNTTGLFFQYHVQNHLSWICRQPSPFLSISSEKWRAVSFAAAFHKLLEIDSTGEDWDHNISRLWNVEDVCGIFGLKFQEYHRNEYLVESFTPQKHITRIYDLDSYDQWQLVDPGASHRNRQQEKMEKLAELKERRKREREEEEEEEETDADRKTYVPWTKEYKTVISQARKKQ